LHKEQEAAELLVQELPLHEYPLDPAIKNDLVKFQTALLEVSDSKRTTSNNNLRRRNPLLLRGKTVRWGEGQAVS
jgi:hypothetical protein